MRLYIPLKTRFLYGLGTVLIFGMMVSFAGAQENASTPDRPTSYTLQPRDTLDVLGQRWNVSVVSLKVANNVTDATLLQPGTTIVVPPDAPPYGTFPPLMTTTGEDPASLGQGGGGVTGDTYVVQPRDTLDTIGQRLDVSVVSLQQANNVTNSRGLMPGTVLVIPDGAPAYGLYPALDQNPEESTESLGQGGGAALPENAHIVQPNQTLDGIAADFNVQTQCLAESNELTDPRKIYPGQTILINKSCPPYDGYDFIGQ